MTIKSETLPRSEQRQKSVPITPDVIQGVESHNQNWVSRRRKAVATGVASVLISASLLASPSATGNSLEKSKNTDTGIGLNPPAGEIINNPQNPNQTQDTELTPALSAENQSTQAEKFTNSPTIESVVESEKQKEIEEKYNIELLTVNQAHDILGISEKTSDSQGWTNNQLDAMESVLSYLPKSLTEPINGNKVKVFTGDLQEEQCHMCAGAEFQGTRIIGFQLGKVDPNKLSDLESIAAHEFTHAFDFGTNHSLWPEVKDILGDESFLNLTDFNQIIVGAPEWAKLQEDLISCLKKQDFKKMELLLDQNSAIETLTSLGKDKSFVEGIAAISQSYIKGEERFLQAYGPLLDGSGYGNDSEAIENKESLEQKYPKAEKLYSLYKDSVFGGKQYSPDQTPAS